MTIQILGTGCARCKALEEQARKAALELGGAVVEKITDLDRIHDMGVMMTPGLAVDGRVLSTGKILSKDQILALIRSPSHDLKADR